MIQIKKIFLVLFGIFLLWGCVDKEYVKQESAFIVFKTPTFKYADLGFIYKNSNEIKIEIYGSGQALMTLEILNKNICMSALECMQKKSFNAYVLSRWYPEETIEEIFRAKYIFGGKGLRKNSNGFTQKIKGSDKYDIHYYVFNKEILFRDTINNILIKVKRTAL